MKMDFYAMKMDLYGSLSLALSRAAYRAIKKAMVAASVAAPETTIVPGTMPKSTPAVIVRGIAGRATISRAVYRAPYAT